MRNWIVTYTLKDGTRGEFYARTETHQEALRDFRQYAVEEQIQWRSAEVRSEPEFYQR